MKFRFCGGLDAPDWLLAEIAVVSKLSSVRVKVLVMQVIGSIKGKEVDFAKVQKLTEAQNLSESDAKASLAALRFIITSYVRFDVKEEDILQELQQIGLPKEHADAIIRQSSKDRDSIRSALESQSLRLPHFEGLDWRLDYDVAATNAQEDPGWTVHMNVKYKDPAATSDQELAFTVNMDRVRVLRSELQKARAAVGSVAEQLT